ncbi:dienelactone hydrolase family protein [Streptomyces sp. NPDC057474]|uniref:dienelactone hydrolase family protein n=1 Tax=Streptomyces sp. NPDC057474 TaxID=3346144 RepID=UPI0036C84B92
MHVTVRSTTVDILTQDGTADAYFAYPDDGVAHPAVVLYMDAFGLRPALRTMANRIAGAGYMVLAPNVFYRSGRAPVVPLPEFIADADRPTLFKRIRPMMGGMTGEVVTRDAAAYLDWLAACPEAASGPVGVAGYCMGARLALLTAGRHPEKVAAAAGFHGAGLATDAPDSPHLLADRITAELYFGHADQDPSMPPEQIERLAKALTAAGVRHRSDTYTGADHGYTMADTDRYAPEAAERHWAAMLDLFGRAL